ERKIALWSVFVPQTARESARPPEIPHEIGKQLKKEGQLQADLDEKRMAEQRESYLASAARPVLEIIERERLLVVLGDPGAGKTSLLKYLAMRWVETSAG